MLRRIDLRGEKGPLKDRLPRPNLEGEAPLSAVRELLREVREGGDVAIRTLTHRFDGVDIDTPLVEERDLRKAWQSLDVETAEALQAAHDRILHFQQEEAQPPRTVTQEGITVTSVPQPMERVGLYVPGGLAAYPSTVLMTSLPARAAGVEQIMLCTPPNPTGDVETVVLASAYLCGVAELYKIGGVQAIAAMAYGTESIEPVDVIAGPGNIWVATAKQEVAGVVGIASAFAGPSEIVVVADKSCPSSSAAVDLVLQAEHGPGGRAWLITWEEDYADEVVVALEQIVALSPRHSETLATLTADGYVCLVENPEAAIEVANQIAPEHLQLMCLDAPKYASAIKNAGAVFVGIWASASIGDYLAGPSHVLPTSGTARFSGALTVDDFQKRMHIIDVSKPGFDAALNSVNRLATAEGLWAHAASVTERERWATDGVIS
ncbi:MAG: histidinol dehydrogenase [Actinomycetota bacterium]|nr:histidinol dehydrogenase [Actinomycetota bacterium]